MPNSLSIVTTVTSVVDGARTTLNSSNNLNTTSSNFISGTQQMTSSAATNISLGSLTDVLAVTVINDNSVNTASVIQVTGSVGGIGAVLIPGSQAVLPWSGSLGGLSGKVIGGYPPGTATPANGTVQWSAQQS